MSDLRVPRSFAALMLSRLARLLVLMAAVQILGGHWAVLQSVAWVGMVVKYSEAESLGTALEKTFNGAHPCGLCVVVQEGQSEEKERGGERTVMKVDAILVAKFQAPTPASRPWVYLAESLHAEAAPLAPPTPPPLA